MITSPLRETLSAPSWKNAETNRGGKVGQMFVRRCSSLGSEGGCSEKDVGGCGGGEVESCAVGQSVGCWLVGGVLDGREAGGGSCVPAHPVCALQGQGLGLVRGGRTGRAAEGGAVRGRGVTGGVRVLSVEL